MWPFSACSRCLSGCTAAFTCSVFDPLIVGGGLPQGLALQPHLLEAVCLSRAEKTGKALCHNALPVLLVHSNSITGLRLPLYVVSQEQLTAFALGAGLFSAQHPPLKAGWGLTFLAFSGHAEMHRIQEIPTRWHRAALAPLPDLMDGFHRSVHAGLFPIPAKNSRQPWRIPDTASR